MPRPPRTPADRPAPRGAGASTPQRPAKPRAPAANIAGLESRRAALDILNLVRAGANLDDALAACRSFDALKGSDRAFARLLATTVLRRQGALDELIGRHIEQPLPKRAARALDILRLCAAQTALLGVEPHAAVSTAVALAQAFRETSGYDGLVNAVARKMAADGAEFLRALPERVDTPAWLYRSWERAYGPKEARAIAAANQREAPLDLTVKFPAETDALCETLAARRLPTGSLRLEKAGDVAALAGFADGAWWVQDAAAALPARLLGAVTGAVSGARALDLCAAPGGKTMQLAANGAEVTAVDLSGERLKRVAENLARVGLAAKTVKADATAWAPDERWPFILLDAPCSATGTMRRHPDIAWSRKESDLDALTRLQARLLDRAADLLEPGGLLVYATCSLQPEEGEAQIEAALARRPDLRREKVAAGELPGLEAAITRDGDVRTLPSLWAEWGGLDGFFIARLRAK